jgi:hypothetical protein
MKLERFLFKLVSTDRSITYIYIDRLRIIKLSIKSLSLFAVINLGGFKQTFL